MQENLPFLRGGGDMGGHIRTFDWSLTAIGTPETWPSGLKTLVSVMLSSKFPMVIWWGEDLVQFYNDAYKPNMVYQGKYPGGIGQTARECWTDVWDYISPLIDEVRETGEAVWRENLPIPIIRNGKVETVHWTFCYSPIRDENGDEQGIFVVCHETTSNIQLIEKLQESEAKFKSLIEQAPVATCLFTGPEFIIEIVNEKMFRFFGDIDVIGKPVLEAFPGMKDEGFSEWLEEVYYSGQTVQRLGVPSVLTVNGETNTYYFDFTYKPLFNEDGSVYGVINMAANVTSRIESDKKIIEIQQQILDSFEESPVGIAIIMGTDLVFTMANRFYGELVDRKPENLVGKKLFEALPELEGQGFDELLLGVIRTGIPYVANEVSVELMRGGQLETIFVDLAYQPKYDSEHEVTGVLVVATDVTQQVKARREVEASEQRLKSLIDSAPVGIGLFIGRDLVIESPNQTFIDIVGKGWDIVGKPLREAMPELISEGQPFLDILDNVYVSGETFTSPGSMVKIVQDGQMTNNYYNITYKPLFDENGEVYGILDIAVDVTETVNAIKKAREAEKSLQGAVELAELAMWRMDVRTGEVFYSDRLKSWIGTDGNLTAGESVYDVLPDEQKEYIKSRLQLAINGNGNYDEEHPIVNIRTGQSRIIHTQAQLFRDDNGEPAYLTGTAQDVTAQRKLQQELEMLVNERTEKLRQANHELKRSNDELEKFAYIASHDLQEPVRKISTFAKMLEHRLDTKDEKALHYMERIGASADRMGSLIRDLLGFSRLTHQETFEPTDLDGLLQMVISDFELVIEQKKATISHDYLPTIDAVPLQIEQLFHNLISNSLKYSKDGIPVAIDIRASHPSAEELEKASIPGNKKYVKLTFRDNGIGFSNQYAEQIFEIFQRLHGKSEYAGTGIGLAMCRKIAQNHNGAISAASDNGAVFTVILPLKQENQS